ncbi:transposase [Mesorhizobium sp. M1004]
MQCGIRCSPLHVLPEGFHRIRYYGFLGNRHRAQKLARCRDLLGTPVSEPSVDPARMELSRPLRGPYRHSLRQCPACHQGQMIVIEIFDVVTGPPPYCDTS